MKIQKNKKIIAILGAFLVLGLGFAGESIVSQLDIFLKNHQAPPPTVINAVGTIEVAFSPKNGATATILKAINEAEHTILVAAYSFTSKEIAKGLLDAKKRGVRVKIILDRSQAAQKYSSSTFFANQGFDLRIDVKHAIFHDKVMIIDGKNLITGSFNFTQAAELKNAENVLIFRGNLPLVKLYEADWLANWDKAITRDEFFMKYKSKVKQGHDE